MCLYAELPWNFVYRINDLAPSTQWSQYQADSDVVFPCYWQCPLPPGPEQTHCVWNRLEALIQAEGPNLNNTIL